MTEPALLDLARELETPDQRPPELEVDIIAIEAIEDDNDELLDPWFLRSEEEIAQIEDDPTAKIHEIRITGYSVYGTGFDDNIAAF